MPSLFLDSAVALVARGDFGEAGVFILGEAIASLRQECMRKTGLDPRQQVSLCLKELKRGVPGKPDQLKGLELGVPFKEVLVNWDNFFKHLHAAAAASEANGREITPLMQIEAQVARQILSDHKKGLKDERHARGAVYSAEHEVLRGGKWERGNQGIDVGSTVAKGGLRARFNKREKDLLKTSGSDALVKAMRHVKGQPHSRFLLRSVQFVDVDKLIHRGAGLVTRVAEFAAIAAIFNSNVCMNATTDVMQFKTLDPKEAAAMGERTRTRKRTRTRTRTRRARACAPHLATALPALTNASRPRPLFPLRVALDSAPLLCPSHSFLFCRQGVRAQRRQRPLPVHGPGRLLLHRPPAPQGHGLRR